MDPIGVLSRALDQTGDLLDHVHADVLDRPTPCSEWNVSTLADHVVNDAHQFLLMVQGKQPGQQVILSDDAKREWQEVQKKRADVRGAAPLRRNGHRLRLADPRQRG